MKALVILCSIVFSLCNAQEVKIKGTVRSSSSGEPLPFTNVFVKDGTRWTSTDTKGYYELELKPGNYQILASYIGYKTETVPVTVGAEEVRLNFSLTSTDVILQEVSVYAATTTENKEVSSMSIQSEEIVQISSIANDVFRSIQSLPGVSVNNELDAKFNVRGGNYDENLVLVNGTQVYEPFHVKEADNASVGIFNMDLMKKVNIITGGFSAQYGDRLSSVLNIEYREGNRDKFSGSTTLSLTNLAGVYEGPFFSNGSFILGVRKSYTEYILALIQDDKPMTISFYDIQGVVTYNLSDVNKLQLKFIHAGDDFKEDPEFESSGPYRGNGGAYGQPAQLLVTEHSYDESDARYFSNLIDVKNSSLLTGNVLLTSSLSYYEQIDDEYSYNSDDWSAGITFNSNPNRTYLYSALYEVTYNNTLTVRTLEPKVVLEAKINPFYEIKTGASYLNIHYGQYLIDQAVRTFRESYPQYPDTTETLFNENFNAFPQNIRANTYKLAGFVENVIQVSDDLIVNAGGRVDYFDFNRDLTFCPRVSASYMVGEGLTLRGAWGHYYQSPIYPQLAYSFASDTNTQSQKAEHYIVSLERNTVFGSDEQNLLTLKAEGYYKKYSDLISSVRNNYGAIYYSRKNDAKGYTAGADLYASLKAPGYYGWISYGLLYAKEDLLTDTEGEFPRYTDQRHTLSLVNDIDLGKDWDLNLRFTYGSGFAFTPYFSQLDSSGTRYEWSEGKKNSEHLPAYKRVDLRLGKEFSLFGTSANAFLDVSNLLNFKNVFAYRYRYDNNGNPYRTETELWPILPSLGMTVKF